jgi:hypothetical protein
MYRISFLCLAFGQLLASCGCHHCGHRPAVYDPWYGPYNPYAGNCVNEDVWTTPGYSRSGCDCYGRQPVVSRDCGCSAPRIPTNPGCGCQAPAPSFPTGGDCGCHPPIPVTSDCGCSHPVTSDCGCSGSVSSYPMQGYEMGPPQIIYGEPIYEGPTPMPGPPSAPPSSDEYYIPRRSNDSNSNPTSETRNSPSNLPATLVVPARL